uniref:Uncharacterized protein n=1 Tax=Arundo donax TaxID=35708 RepID=A0A0A9CD52_ARUDO
MNVHRSTVYHQPPLVSSTVRTLLMYRQVTFFF